jgi:hypothetical protein
MEMRSTAGIRDDFEVALRSDEPVMALRDAVKRLLEQGSNRQVLMAALQEFREGLQQAHRDADEDVVLDVMDFLSGWTSPHLAL